MLISIVTINLNNADGLDKTIESVINQDCDNYELVIVDGDSSDGSKAIIEKYRNNISKLIIEKDSGIYDAMNKGIKLANGDFILFLNSGDAFEKRDAIKIITSFLINRDENPLLFFRAKISYGENAYYIPSFKVNNDNFPKWLLKQNKPTHQTILFPKCFYKINNYSLEYKIASDSDYKIKALKILDVIFLDDVLIKYELGGISSKPNKIRTINRIIKESAKIENLYYGYNSYRKSLIFTLVMYFKYVVYHVVGEKKYYAMLCKKLNKL